MKMYFRMPKEEEEIVAIEIPENATLEQIEERLKSFLDIQDSVIRFVYFDKPLREEEIIGPNRWRGLDEDLPIDFVCLKNQANNVPNNNDCDIDIKNQYRVWFSNNPASFLPQFEQIVLEESILSNPDCVTTLVVDKSILNDEAKKQLDEWSKRSKCQIIDIDEINPSNSIDKMILKTAKNEIKNWLSPPYVGNPGIASDLIRLLFIDKGIYFDCDIFACEGLSSKIYLSQGWFTNLTDISLGIPNNDVMSFSSIAGRTILEQYKVHVLNKYFSKNMPSIENLSGAINNIMEDRTKKMESFPSVKEQEKYLSNLVTNIAGPCSLRNFFEKTNSKFNNIEVKIINFLDHLKIDAKDDFLKEIKQNSAKTGLSWLPSHNINSPSNRMEGNLDLFRKHLKRVSDSRKDSGKGSRP